jgi:hypothetical protein
MLHPYDGGNKFVRNVGQYQKHGATTPKAATLNLVALRNRNVTISSSKLE